MRKNLLGVAVVGVVAGSLQKFVIAVGQVARVDWWSHVASQTLGSSSLERHKTTVYNTDYSLQF